MPDDQAGNHRSKPRADSIAAAAEAVMRGRDYGFALLDGPPLAGVTRSMFDAVKSTAPTARLINTDVTRLAEIANTSELFAQLRPDEQYVVWLDDLSPADLNLLGTGVLDKICQRAAVMANVNTAVCDRLLADRAPVTSPARTVLLEYAIRVHVPFELSAQDHSNALAMYPQLVVTSSIGEALVGGNTIVGRYHDGAVDNPDGHTLVSAAVDARRCGIHRGLSETELRGLFDAYCGRRRSSQAFTRAVDWATDVPAGASIGPVGERTDSRGQSWKALGYVAGADDGDHQFPVRPIPESGWASMVEVLADTDGYALGIGAQLRGRPDIAIAALTRAARGHGTPGTTAAAAAALKTY